MRLWGEKENAGIAKSDVSPEEKRAEANQKRERENKKKVERDVCERIYDHRRACRKNQLNDALTHVPYVVAPTNTEASSTSYVKMEPKRQKNTKVRRDRESG